MPIVTILAFGLILAFGADPAEPPWRLKPAALAIAVALYLLGSAGVAWLLTRTGLRRLEREADSYANVVRRQHKLLAMGQAWLLAGLGALLAAGLMARLQAAPGISAAPMGPEVLCFLLFATAIGLFWRVTYPFDRAIRLHVEQELLLAGQPVRGGWTAWEHLEFNFRHQVLFVAVPVLMILVGRDVFTAVVLPRVMPDAPTWVEPLILAAVVGAVFLLSPAVLVHVWRTRTMPKGELRDRLERLCQRIGLRYRDIRIWDTGGVMVNAGVMGVRPWVRYVMISDAMLEQMDDRQIVAVFGHEAGHVKHHHIAQFLLFTTGAMSLCLATSAWLSAHVRQLGWSASWAGLAEGGLMLGLLALVWGVGFGMLSRLFERQADVHGAWCAALDAEEQGYPEASGGNLRPGATVFAAALENVGRLNGMPREGRNWRHGSIASRVRFLLGWVSSGASRENYDDHIRWVQVLLWAVLALGLLAAAATRSVWL